MLNGLSKRKHVACSRVAEFEFVERRILFANVPQGFIDSLIGADLASPVAIDFAPDGRTFVTEQGGRIRVIDGGRTALMPFATLTVDSNGERGLLGIAVDPNFAQNNFVYVYYTATTPTVHNRVSRFTASGNTAVPGSETILLELDPLSSATNHNGGSIHFGPDGKLYVAQGDNANSAQSQSLTSRFGKILRINPDGSIPGDNPFFNAAAGDNRAIWALGLRNPSTFAFSRDTGKLFINDVGSDKFEEINEGAAGANYGWPGQEGPPSSNADFKGPDFFYGRTSGEPQGTAITAGTFYDGPTKSFPAEYANDYFFADISGRWIWRLDAGTGAAKVFATDLGPAVDLKVSPDGSLFYVSHDAGQVRRIQVDPENPPLPAKPTIQSQPAPASATVGGAANFIVGAGGEGLTYQWQRNGVAIDGATAATLAIPAVSIEDNGAEYRAVITNGGGSVTSTAAKLTVTSGDPNMPPTAMITAPVAGRPYSAGQTIRFKGTGIDPEDRKLPASAYSWSVDFHHDGVAETVVAPTAGIKAGSFKVPREAGTSTDVFYRVTLTVTDSVGGATTVSRDVSPRTATVTVNTTPPGLAFRLDGQTHSGPFSFEGVVGSRVALAADASQVVDGVNYSFKKWTKGKKPAFEFVVPAKARTLTAGFVKAGA